jgi:AcrR family transcriptional regulator
MREVACAEAHQQGDPQASLHACVDLDDVRPIVYETTVERMARPVNPTRRAEVLDAAAAYVLAHGLAGLSLRPLAKTLGTSPRMLLYDFGSKEQLVNEVLAEIRRREERLLDADVHSLDEVWRWIAAPEREAFLRLFFEVYVAAMKRGEASPFVREWVDFLTSRVDETTATLLIAVVRGLLLDRLATGDTKRTDAALALAARALPAF